MYKIKRTSNDEKGTFYQLFYGDFYIHYEFCRSALEKIRDRLKSGEVLYDILTDEFKAKETKIIQQYDNELSNKDNEFIQLEDKLKSEIEAEKNKPKEDLSKNNSLYSIPEVPATHSARRSLGYRRDDYSIEEVRELLKYCLIFKINRLTAHWNVNELITSKGLWDEFPIMRSMNTHSNGYRTQGIREKYFSIVCDALDIDGDGGSKLEKAEHY